VSVRSRCLVLALAALLIVPASAQAAFHFAGRSSQGEKVTFVVSSRITKVTHFSFDWDARCASGATYAESTGFPTMPVSRTFHFADFGNYDYTEVSPYYSAAAGRNLSFHVNGTLKGYLPRKPKPKGTFSGQVVIKDPATQQQIDTCASGKVTWKAKFA
jgi:hypothetical protein